MQASLKRLRDLLARVDRRRDDQARRTVTGEPRDDRPRHPGVVTDLHDAALQAEVHRYSSDPSEAGRRRRGS